jgi:hypothetical protein
MLASSSSHLLRAVTSVLARFVVFLFVILLVWVTYVYLFAYYPDFLGWSYNILRPWTVWMFNLIEQWLPNSIKFKVSAGLTDELGPRALFLLLLGGVGEAVLFSLFWSIAGLFRLATRGRSKVSSAPALKVVGKRA